VKAISVSVFVGLDDLIATVFDYCKVNNQLIDRLNILQLRVEDFPKNFFFL